MTVSLVRFLDVALASCRLTALRSLTLQTAGHNASMAAGLGVLRLHPSLVQLRLLHHRGEMRATTTAPIVGEIGLPVGLTSLQMKNWGCGTNKQSVDLLLDGAEFAMIQTGSAACALRTLPSDQVCMQMPGHDSLRSPQRICLRRIGCRMLLQDCLWRLNQIDGVQASQRSVPCASSTAS